MLEKPPSAPHGEPDGPDAPEAPNRPPGAAEAHVGQCGAPLPPAAAPLQAAGEPGTLPEVWCRKCEATVKPEGKGRCPRCQTFLRQNFVARRHPVNKLRKQQLLDQLVADYRPSTTVLQSSCEMLAGILEQLEVLKPGSPDHQRLVQLSQLLGAALEESRPAREARTPTDYADLTVDELIERTAAMLRELVEMRDNDEKRKSIEITARPDSSPFDSSPIVDVRDAAERDVLAPPAVADTTAPAPASVPEPQCGYGCGSLTRCAEIKATRPDAWSALHYTDPAEVKKRDEYATKVMMARVGKPHPWDY